MAPDGGKGGKGKLECGSGGGGMPGKGGGSFISIEGTGGGPLDKGGGGIGGGSVVGLKTTFLSSFPDYKLATFCGNFFISSIFSIY